MTTPTPMMTQWHECKTQAKEALLFFRLGDFYEAFYEDAQAISKQIGLTLTSRQGIPMCGVPYHTAEIYIDKLISKGYKIAIAEQTEDPKTTKGLLKREIVRTITPGTLITSQLLKDKKNNFFASLSKIGVIFGLSLIDLTTGEFRAIELDHEDELLDELFRLRPAEFLVGKKFQELHPLFLKELSHSFPFVINEREELDLKSAQEVVSTQFKQANLLQGQVAALQAAGNLLSHLKQELHLHLDHVTTFTTEALSQFMNIDRATLRNLDLVESVQGGATLLDLIDETSTSMGARLLSNWLKYPLLSCSEIEKRQEAIATWLQHPELSQKVQAHLEQVRDLERLMMRIVSRFATPKDLLALGLSLSHLPDIESLTQEFPFLSVSFFDSRPLFEKIIASLVENPPLRLGDGDVFKDGVHPELDALRSLSKDSVQWMEQYQTTLREETAIKTLKVGYTRAFGYYIEVSRAQSEKVPAYFHRRQTLTNGERYITDELKKFEYQFLTAEERSRALQSELFEELRAEIATQAGLIHAAAKTIARLDALLSLALVAQKYEFVRPIVDQSHVLEIKEGRHPIIEKVIGRSSFISNDTDLSPERQMMLITGPNMAGKSTYIRQVALIAVLAQIGSFVPASSARVGLIDKIFSRIGASDDLARGQSTFMVEMSETANILHHATSRSLVLLDEIGRGTSTYDGISIAWAVAEFLLTATDRQAKTLFATHYWELTRLETEYPHAMNFQIAVKEIPSGIVFLRKIIPGGTDKSYGIHVAKLAGLPKAVIQKAEERLLRLEAKSPRKRMLWDEQLPLFAPPPPENPILTELKSLDLNQLTPLQAQQKLFHWKTML